MNQNKDIEEAAKQIVDKYVQLFIQSNADNWTEPSRQAAIIHVDGIIEVLGMAEVLADRKLAEEFEKIKSAIQNL